jgi:hypothetical protein
MKTKKPTRKELIILLLHGGEIKMTCGAIVKKIIAIEGLTGSVAHYLSGSISSILNKLVKEDVLKYAEGKGPRGGHIYQLNRNAAGLQRTVEKIEAKRKIATK